MSFDLCCTAASPPASDPVFFERSYSVLTPRVLGIPHRLGLIGFPVSPFFVCRPLPSFRRNRRRSFSVLQILFFFRFLTGRDCPPCLPKESPISDCPEIAGTRVRQLTKPNPSNDPTLHALVFRDISDSRPAIFLFPNRRCLSLVTSLRCLRQMPSRASVRPLLDYILSNGVQPPLPPGFPLLSRVRSLVCHA